MRRVFLFAILTAVFLGLCAPALRAQQAGEVSQEAAELLKKLTDADEQVRMDAADGLVKMGRAAVQPLMGMLKGKDANVLSLSVYALGEIGDSRAVGPLLGLLGPGDGTVRSHAAWALGRIGDPKALEPLRKLFLKSDAGLIRVCCAFGTARMGKDKEALDFLAKHLKDPDSNVRFRATWAAGLLGLKKTLKPLKKLWKTEKDKVVKTAQALALVCMAKDKAALDFLSEAIFEADLKLMWNAQKAMNEIIANWTSKLQTGSKKARTQAAIDLCHIGQASSSDMVIEQVKPLMDSTNPDTREAAMFTFG
jgi:HEAT repeat protein